MSINGINLNSNYGQEMLKNMANMYHKDLDISNAINLDDPELQATQNSLPENIGNMHINWDMTNKSELNLKNFDGTEVNTTNFNSILNTMDMTDDQRTTLNKAMQAASDVLNKNQTNGDTYGMRISQTNMEFKYISANLLPEKYQDTFNTYIDKYTQELSDHYVDLEKRMAGYLTTAMESNQFKTDWQNKGQASQNAIENGTDVYQASTKEYQNLYHNVDVTNKDTVKEQLDSVYKDILTKGTSSLWGADSAGLSSEVKYLSEKWNSFMDAIGENSSMKFTTSIDYRA